MTIALCLYCGDLKFGALCPCSSCATHAVDFAELNILFSDHQIPKEDLTQFGEIIAHFRTKTHDQMLVFWAFVHYISEHHGNLLKAEIPDEWVDRVEDIYVESELPELTIGSY